MNVEMFLDASEGGQVKTTVDKLLAAVLPAKGTDDKQKPVAPYVSLGWGKVTYVTCAVVNSVSAKYTRFDADGQAIRAVVTVVAPGGPAQHSCARTRRRGRSAPRAPTWSWPATAWRRSPRASTAIPDNWRAIADANGIDDPFRRAARPAPARPHAARAVSRR